MAEIITKGAATPAAASSGSPSGQSKSVPETAAQAGASVSSSADDLMAGMGLTFTGVPDSPGDKPDSSTQAETPGDKEQEQQGEQSEGETASEGEAEADKAQDEPEVNFSEDGAPVLGSYEQSVVDALKSHDDLKPHAKRIAKAFELAVSRREALAAKETELAQKDETIKDMEARLQETADKATLAPSGPLAHLSDKAALQAEVAKCADYLDWVEDNPDAVEHYQDTEKATAQQQLDYWKRYARNVLKHQGEQARVLEEREKIRAEVKKQRPTLFDVKHPENQILTDLYKSDPRTRADFDQLVADALRGRQLRETAAKSPGPVKAAETGARAAEKKTATKADLPKPKQVSDLVLQRSGVSARETVEAKARQQGGATFDEMVDAGLLSKQAA